jgi:hypothetical protein
MGLRPYGKAQNYGSCVDASCAEHEDSLFGWRAAHPAFLRDRGQKREIWKHSAAWYKYCERGYCSDGWNGSGCASAAYKVGAAFTIRYEIGSNSIDFSDENDNERIVARSWCRSGVPSWLKDYTLEHHSYEDGAITRFNGGIKELLTLFANGGVIHTSGTRTSGGSKPFSIGSVGPHMQSGVGGDDSDFFREFCQQTIGVSPRDDDFPVIMNQTWGPGWRGECADRYWPFGMDADGRVWTQADINQAMQAGIANLDFFNQFNDTWGWGPKPEGAWVWWASDVLRRLSCDYGWLPWVTGFPTDDPIPPEPSLAPKFNDGTLFAVTEDGRIIIESTPGKEPKLTIPANHPGGTFAYVTKPVGNDRFVLVPKPDL